MIKFSLVCDQAHEFESWFANSTAFEAQSGRGLVSCPFCGSKRTSKAVMAPFVAAKTRLEKSAGSEAVLSDTDAVKMRSAVQSLRAHVVENAEDVGSGFSEEARKQHFGETKAKPIYGTASAQDVAGLLEDGVDIMPLPDAGN